MFMLKGIFFFAEYYLMSRVGQSVLRDLRRDVFRHLKYLPVRYFEDRNTGHIMSRVTSDITILQNVIQASVGVAADVLTIAGLVSWILWLHITSPCSPSRPSVIITPTPLRAAPPLSKSLRIGIDTVLYRGPWHPR
jgi:ABC-type multidrug transport system fused ATPase/permease subunit